METLVQTSAESVNFYYFIENNTEIGVSIPNVFVKEILQMLFIPHHDSAFSTSVEQYKIYYYTRKKFQQRSNITLVLPLLSNLVKLECLQRRGGLKL